MNNTAARSQYFGAASAFDCIDDTQGAPDDDTTYIFRVFNAALTGNPAVKFGAVTDPGTDTGWNVKYRVKASGIGTQNIVFELYQGDPDAAGSVLESKTQSVTTSYVTGTWTLLDATVSSISNFSDLYMRLTTSGSSGQTCRLTQLYIEVPDPPVLGGCLLP